MKRNWILLLLPALFFLAGCSKKVDLTLPGHPGRTISVDTYEGYQEIPLYKDLKLDENGRISFKIPQKGIAKITIEREIEPFILYVNGNLKVKVTKDDIGSYRLSGDRDNEQLTDALATIYNDIRAIRILSSISLNPNFSDTLIRSAETEKNRIIQSELNMEKVYRDKEDDLSKIILGKIIWLRAFLVQPGDKDNARRAADLIYDYIVENVNSLENTDILKSLLEMYLRASNTAYYDQYGPQGLFTLNVKKWVEGLSASINQYDSFNAIIAQLLFESRVSLCNSLCANFPQWVTPPIKEKLPENYLPTKKIVSYPHQIESDYDRNPAQTVVWGNVDFERWATVSEAVNMLRETADNPDVSGIMLIPADQEDRIKFVRNFIPGSYYIALADNISEYPLIITEKDGRVIGSALTSSEASEYLKQIKR